jgi:hypothetical protein
LQQQSPSVQVAAYHEKCQTAKANTKVLVRKQLLEENSTDSVMVVSTLCYHLLKHTMTLSCFLVHQLQLDEVATATE